MHDFKLMKSVVIHTIVTNHTICFFLFAISDGIPQGTRRPQKSLLTYFVSARFYFWHQVATHSLLSCKSVLIIILILNMFPYRPSLAFVSISMAFLHEVPFHWSLLSVPWSCLATTVGRCKSQWPTSPTRSTRIRTRRTRWATGSKSRWGIMSIVTARLFNKQRWRVPLIWH